MSGAASELGLADWSIKYNTEHDLCINCKSDKQTSQQFISLKNYQPQ